MIENLSESIPTEAVSNEAKFPWFSNFRPDWPDDSPKKRKKRRKKHRNRKKISKQHEYAQLAFQYGALASRYDTLTRMVELAVSAKRQQLDDNLLGDGLISLGPLRTSLPWR